MGQLRMCSNEMRGTGDLFCVLSVAAVARLGAGAAVLSHTFPALDRPDGGERESSSRAVVRSNAFEHDGGSGKSLNAYEHDGGSGKSLNPCDEFCTNRYGEKICCGEIPFNEGLRCPAMPRILADCASYNALPVLTDCTEHTECAGHEQCCPDICEPYANVCMPGQRNINYLFP